MFTKNWHTYFVKAAFEDKKNEWPEVSAEKIAAHNAAVKRGREAQFLQFPNPIITYSNVRSSIAIERDGKTGRIYPPFPLNEKEAMTAYVAKAKYPLRSSGDVIDTYAQFPETAVKGLTIEPLKTPQTQLCHALRMDVESGFPVIEVYQELLIQVVQHTYQWWLRSPQTPFRGPLFMGAFIDDNGSILEELRYKGAQSVDSTWHGVAQTQSLWGLERILDEQAWSVCLEKVQKRIPVETGILSFVDAIAHYMANDDKRCLLDLTICFEILANKRMYADNKRMETDNEKLLKKTTLAEEGTKKVLRQLLIDRDHVAHGRDPYISNKDPAMMTNYFQAIRSVINKYFSSLDANEFHELATIKMGEKPKKASA